MPETDADIPKRTHYRTEEQAGLATSLSVLPESVDRRLDKPAPKIGVFLEVPTACLGARKAKPYQHVVVDEAQDLHEAQWRLLRAVVAEAPDDMFIVGVEPGHAGHRWGRRRRRPRRWFR